MKQLYLLVAVCLYCTVTTHAQTKYWIGLPTGANWNDANNWSDNSGSSIPGTTIPNGASYNVVFEQNAIVNVDLAAITLNSLTVTGTNVRLYTAAGVSTAITLNSTSTVTPALLINSGSTLEDSCGGNGQSFLVNYANGAQARVDGTWYLTSVTGFPPAISYTELPGTNGLGNLLQVNGTIKVSNGGHVQCTVPAYLSFNGTGQFWHNRNAGSVPSATWSNTSTLLITGLQTNGMGQFGIPAAGLGNLVINCTSLTTPTTTVGLPNGLIVNGNIQVLSTNNINLTLGAAGGSATNNYTVQGDLSISPNSNVTLGGQTNTNAYSMQLNGNFIQTGGSFYLRNALAGVNQPTTLHVAGNITQSAGTFGCLNTVVNTTTDLFVVELNGAGPGAQTVSLSSGTIDNATNQVALRLNNAAGATLLTPLAVGKISWGTNKGNLTTTTTNVLTINNPDINDTRVVLGQSNAGYVNGPVRRKTATNTTVYYKLPTGKGGVLRECEVLPSTAAAAEFEAEYFNTAYPGGLTVTAPLTGVSGQEYWNIGRTAGSDPAKVQLSLGGTAVSGASATDTLVVAHYTGSNWTDVRGTKLEPGNSTTGSVESMALSSFSPFTFGFTSASTLPIYLLSFTARNDGDVAKLNWTITENSTPQKFEVLRSTDGGSFTQVGTVAGVEGKLIYDFTDNALPAGTVYYRLRMIDIDGSATFTKIVAVMNGSKGVLITSMMPTLVTDRARLNITSSEKTTMQLVITDMYGRAIKRQINSITNGNQEVWMNLGALPAGTYQVTGYLSTGEKTSSIRFIKR